MTETFGRGTSDSFASGSGRRANERDERERAFAPDGPTRERLRGFANRQKDIGAEKISDLADAAHKAADAIAGDNAGIADLVHEAADGLNRASDHLRSRDVGEIYRSLNDFARRQPLTFMACSVAAGVLLSRFLKSSGGLGNSPRQHEYHSSPKLQESDTWTK